MNRLLMRLGVALFLALSSATFVGAAHAQSASAGDEDQASRDQTREQLRAVLQTEGLKIGVAFRQSDKNPYNFVGQMTDGLKNAQSLEIVVSISKRDTIGFRIYPHYKGGYINLGKVSDPAGFAHRLLYLSDQNFLFWGVDDESDSFSGYTITLESGFPKEAVATVLASIHNTDLFVGQLRPMIDGSAAE
jgi:hypothetical protein